ncbi:MULTISPECIES: hypothetical protein [Streptomyces]|uniref:Uncharacterized protein n=1 Tax=Streptomyces sudanensis TaxID=436397 RepID=A0ABY4T9L1_9ACTN|nr:MULTISPECIES: hypothetical protein [Streptomyces]URN15660.1 hypothetical protein MW084_06475 [Streptomyces sudanensis]
MPSDRPILPPVRLRPDAELARAALASPALARAVRLARWAGPGMRAGAGGELAGDRPAEAAEALGLAGGDAGEACAGGAWRVAVGTGLVEVREEPGGRSTVTAGDALPLVTGGAPKDVLALWLGCLETVLADAVAPAADGAARPGGPGRDAEARFLDEVLAHLYRLTAAGGGPVPLPALAASVIVPGGMAEPTDDVLEQVSLAMMRLDEWFRALEPTGLVEYRPVDEALMAREDPDEPSPADLDEEAVARYGMVRLTPLGLYGVRGRLLEAGATAPVVGELAGRGAEELLGAVGGFPPEAARAETEQWLAGREPAAAARELLAAAKGADAGSPLRRLHCQQALALVGAEAEPAVREVLDDPELGGLARVWLAERGAADVPPPPEAMVFWLAVDTIAAQLGAVGDLEELRDLVEGLTGGHSGFLDQAWRVDHPSTPEVLEAMGRLHRDKRTAKDARKAAFKARSRAGS